MLRAKRAGVCACCSGPIAPGDCLLPVSLSPPEGAGLEEGGAAGGGEAAGGQGKARARKTWVHAECAGGVSEEAIPLCKHWAKSGSCMFREECSFRHPPPERLEEERERAAIEGAGEEEHRGGKFGGRTKKQMQEKGLGGGARRYDRRKRIKNEFKCSVFRRWLIDTYGHELLASGSGVLDVAGGKGELAFELLNLNGIEATVVDPRPMSLGRYAKRLEAGIYWRNPLLNRYNTLPPPPRGEGCRVPAHVRVMFEVATGREGGGGEGEGAELPAALQGEGEWGAAVEAARGMKWTKKGLHEEGEHEGAEYDEEDPGGGVGGEEVGSIAEALRIVQECSVVVGMHPDQAAEGIVRFAVRNGKPFACIPCCVYSEEAQFRGRRLRGGQRVTTHEHLVRYLTEACEGARVATLGFEGMNRVVYRPPLA